jgi:hypothetical protein
MRPCLKLRTSPSMTISGRSSVRIVITFDMKVRQAHRESYEIEV